MQGEDWRGIVTGGQSPWPGRSASGDDQVERGQVVAEEVAPGVWRAGTRYVNWYLVDAGAGGVTVVDAGLPAYRRQLGPALARLGRMPSDVRAAVLTHGHIDHVGIADVLAGWGAPVHLHPDDAALAADPRRNRTDSPLLPYLRFPPTVAFLAHCVRQGALRPRPMPETLPLSDGETLDVPGRPNVTHVPGHTDGSCVLEFAEHDVVFVGDALATVSPLSGRPARPQLHTRGFQPEQRSGAGVAGSAAGHQRANGSARPRRSVEGRDSGGGGQRPPRRLPLTPAHGAAAAAVPRPTEIVGRPGPPPVYDSGGLGRGERPGSSTV